MARWFLSRGPGSTWSRWLRIRAHAAQQLADCPLSNALLDELFAARPEPLNLGSRCPETELRVRDWVIPVAGCAHQAGTCRFGTDPADSVLDTNCKAHELDNLYVVDTSFFPSIGAVNPALTAIANALRVGGHRLERIGWGPAGRVTRRPGR
jgi:choline dehydrogenase-like flavoprotein